MGVTPEKRMDATFRKRLKRRLHYGDMTDLDAPSLPMTELSVDYFHDSSPGKLGHVDLETASNIVRQNKVTPCSMVVSVLYARRLRQRNKQYLDSMSSSDVFFISMMMASKYIYDEGTDDEVYNDEWAASMDQDACEVNKMEMDFLEAMDWRLFVRPEEFDTTLDAIEKRLALQEGLKRGWFTYAELDVLMGPDLIGSIWCGVVSEVSKVLATLSAAYLTGLLSMLGSVALATQVSGPLSSATVALMAQHSSFGIVFPLSEDASLLPVSNQRVHLCRHAGVSDQCQSLAELHNGSLVVELDLLDLNETALKERKALLFPSSLQESLGKALPDADGSFFGAGTSEMKARAEKPKPLGDANMDEYEEVVDGYGRSSTISEEKEESQEVLMSASRPATSSLWSLWFLDSLLSQIWSLTTFKSQPPRKTPTLCRKQRRFEKSQHSKGISNDQETGIYLDGSMDGVRPSTDQSISHWRLSQAKAGCSQKCSTNHQSSPTAARDSFKLSHCPHRLSMAKRDCSVNDVDDICFRLSSRPHNTFSNAALFSSNPHSKGDQDSSTGPDVCPLVAALGFELNCPNPSDLTCSGLANSFNPQLCHHALDHWTSFQPSDNQNGYRQACSTMNEPGSQAYIFNLPTSLFSGVYRMLQVA